jgi:hypothetical protein
MMMRTLLFTLFTTLPLMFASAASADEFVFNVPVRIENAPNVVDAVISCGATLRTASGAETYVSANQTITVTGGAYRDTVRLVATIPTGARRENAINWNCTMRPGVRSGAGVSRPTTDVEAWYEDVAGHRVASHTLTAFGYLP